MTSVCIYGNWVAVDLPESDHWPL